MFVDQGFDLKTDQLIQTHVQNGVCLLFRKHKLCSHDFGFFGFKLDAVDLSFRQAGLCHGAVLGATQDLNDQVDNIAGLNQSLLYLLFLHFMSQKVGIFPGCYLILKVNAGLEYGL